MTVTMKQKIDFIYNSNLIEAIDYPQGLYIDWVESKIPEIQSHAFALDYVLENCKKELTQNKILKIHRLLTNGLLSDEESGHYRKCNVTIGNSYGTIPIAIKPEMENLIKMIKKAKTYEDCWECHNEFEVIHPFIDGNGRTGRLILNWLLLKNKLKFEVIKVENRLAYYTSIKKYRFDRALAWSFIKN